MTEPHDTRDKGYSSPEVALAAGVTYRQLDYWIRKDYIKTSIKDAKGQGTQRGFSLHDVVTVAVIAALSKAGMTIETAMSIAAQPRDADGIVWREIGQVRVLVDVATIHENVAKALGMEITHD